MTNIIGIVMNIISTFQISQPEDSFWKTTAIDFSLPYLSISVALNVFLTLIIAIRLILHAKETRTALGIDGIGGLCMAIIAMLVESCALYAVSSLLVITQRAVGNHTASIFTAILSQTQVRVLSRLRFGQVC